MKSCQLKWFMKTENKYFSNHPCSTILLHSNPYAHHVLKITHPSSKRVGQSMLYKSKRKRKMEIHFLEPVLGLSVLVYRNTEKQHGRLCGRGAASQCSHKHTLAFKSVHISSVHIKFLRFFRFLKCAIGFVCMQVKSMTATRFYRNLQKTSKV